MTRNVAKQTGRSPKRRRAVQSARANDRSRNGLQGSANDRIDATFRYASRTHAFVAQLIVPAILAHIARRMGAKFISPEDFYCGCDPSFADGLPLCERKRQNCRYAHRAGVRPRETDLDIMLYRDAWDLATTNYQGPKLRPPRRQK